jgi:5'-nucleotidase
MDTLLEPGPIKYSTISNVFDDFLIVKFIPGNILYNLLEHAVAKYPAFEGRFMMVSGIKFTFDAALPPLSRVIK